jgi:hypothetical protein
MQVFLRRLKDRPKGIEFQKHSGLSVGRMRPRWQNRRVVSLGACMEAADILHLVSNRFDLRMFMSVQKNVKFYSWFTLHSECVIHWKMNHNRSKKSSVFLFQLSYWSRNKTLLTPIFLIFNWEKSRKFCLSPEICSAVCRFTSTYPHWKIVRVRQLLDVINRQLTELWMNPLKSTANDKMIIVKAECFVKYFPMSSSFYTNKHLWNQ